MCHFVSTVPFLTLGCFRPFHPILSFFFTPLPLLISLCFTARKSKSPYDFVSDSHFGSNVLSLGSTAADFPSLTNLRPLVRYRVTLTGHQLLLKFLKRDHVATRAFPRGICTFFLRLPGCPPTLQTLGNGWLESQGGSPRIGWGNWAGMSRS